MKQLMNKFGVIALEATSLIMPHLWMLFFFMEVRDVNQAERSLVCASLHFLQLQKVLFFAVS